MADYTFSVRSDVHRNVMYIEQRGKPTAADFLMLKESFVAEAKRLQPGFSIVNDQREMQTYDEHAMEVAKDLVRLTNDLGAARVIRIVPADLLSTVLLSSTLIAGKSQYASIRVASPEEAEEALQALADQPTH